MSDKTFKRLWFSLAGLLVLALISLASEMDYQDDVAQHKINCAIPTMVLDNNLECGE